jgi:hypothetical protein
MALLVLWIKSRRYAFNFIFQAIVVGATPSKKFVSLLPNVPG